MSSSSRVAFVDLLRFAAAFQMLQGHTLAALLAPELRTGAGFAMWSYARGLTSVAFLFAAGLSFFLATERPDSAPAARRRRVLRAASLIALGYLLHLPLGAWSDDPGTRIAAMHEFAAVDVLQNIGVSMLLLEALRAALPALRLRVPLSLALAAAAIALAPIAADVPAAGPLRPLLAYVTPQAGSLFPLAPWSGHVFFGFVCGAVVRAPGRLAIPVRLAALAAALGACSLVCVWAAAPRVVTDHATRLTGVMTTAFVIAACATRLARVPNLVATLARHTLILYVFHVLLVYGQGVGLATWIGPRLDLARALVAAVFVIGSSCAVAVAYDRLAAARRTG